MSRFKISQVDRQIDANRRELQRRERINPYSAASWQQAWNKHPDLYSRERSLFSRRGELQELRDRVDARAERRARASVPKAKMAKCPTCGWHSIAEAV
jgi:hypothetical protein